MKTITTKKELAEYIKGIPEQAIVHINKGCGKLTWSEKMSGPGQHGETVLIAEEAYEEEL